MTMRPTLRTPLVLATAALTFAAAASSATTVGSRGPCPPQAPGSVIRTAVRTMGLFNHNHVDGYRIVGQELVPDPQAPFNGTIHLITHELITGVTRRLAQGFAVRRGDLAAVYTEEPVVGEDLNGDGTIDDTVVGWVRIDGKVGASGSTHGNTGIVADDVTVADPWLLLRVRESDFGGDLTGDGVADDPVLVAFDTRSSRITLVPLAVAGEPVAHEGRAMTRVSERDSGALDLNGDGDVDDTVPVLVELTSGEWSTLGVAASSIAAATDSDGDLIALGVPEWGEKRDLDGDGDTWDIVLFTASFASPAAVPMNTGHAVDGRLTVHGTRIFADGWRLGLSLYDAATGAWTSIVPWSNVLLEDARADGAEIVFSVRISAYTYELWSWRVDEGEPRFVAGAAHPFVASLRKGRVAWHDDDYPPPGCPGRAPAILFHEIDAGTTMATGRVGSIYTIPSQSGRVLVYNANEIAAGEDLDGNGTIDPWIEVIEAFLLPCTSIDDLRETLAAAGVDVDRYRALLDEARESRRRGAALSRLTKYVIVHGPDLPEPAVAAITRCVEDLR